MIAIKETEARETYIVAPRKLLPMYDNNGSSGGQLERTLPSITNTETRASRAERSPADTQAPAPQPRFMVPSPQSVDNPKPHVCKCRSQEVESKFESYLSLSVRSKQIQTGTEVRSLSNIGSTHCAAQARSQQHTYNKAIEWQQQFKLSFILLSSVYLSKHNQSLYGKKNHYKLVEIFFLVSFLSSFLIQGKQLSHLSSMNFDPFSIQLVFFQNLKMFS